MKDNHYSTKHRLPCRERIFDLIAKDVANKRVLYMEFGVFQGRAARHWSKLLRHPESHLHGFDSFEGLPESWGALIAGKDISLPTVRFLRLTMLG
jgi:hypothetical protein